jgi:hypothetical protein
LSKNWPRMNFFVSFWAVSEKRFIWKKKLVWNKNKFIETFIIIFLQYFTRSEIFKNSFLKRFLHFLENLSENVSDFGKKKILTVLFNLYVNFWLEHPFGKLETNKLKNLIPNSSFLFSSRIWNFSWTEKD